MAICPGCGTLNNDNNKFCMACGAVIPVMQPAQPVQAAQPVTQPVQPAQPAPVLSDSAKAVADSLQAVNDSINKAMANAENKKDLEYVHQAGNVLYFGRVPGSPEVGDVRVTFEKVVPAKVTVMAVADGDTFKPFKAKNGKRFETLVMGKKTGDEIIQDAEDANSMWTWILRIVGILLVISAFKNIFGFLTTLLKVVPFLANIVGWGVGLGLRRRYRMHSTGYRLFTHHHCYCMAVLSPHPLDLPVGYRCLPYMGIRLQG